MRFDGMALRCVEASPVSFESKISKISYGSRSMTFLRPLVSLSSSKEQHELLRFNDKFSGIGSSFPNQEIFCEEDMHRHWFHRIFHRFRKRKTQADELVTDDDLSDSLSCYNEFRTKDLDERLGELQQAVQVSNLYGDLNEIPVFPPLHELTDDELERLKQTLFSIPMTANDEEEPNQLKSNDTCLGSIQSSSELILERCHQSSITLSEFEDTNRRYSRGSSNESYLSSLDIQDPSPSITQPLERLNTLMKRF